MNAGGKSGQRGGTGQEGLMRWVMGRQCKGGVERERQLTVKMLVFLLLLLLYCILCVHFPCVAQNSLKLLN